MGIRALGYVGVGAQDPAAWTRYAGELFGLAAEKGGGDSVVLRLDDRAQRIVVESARPGLAYLGWEVPDRAALDELAARLDDSGVEVLEATQEVIDRRRVDHLICCLDPSGNRVEVTTPVASADRPFEPAGEVSGFVAGDLGVGHVALYVDGLAPSLRFYRDLLGLRISEEFPALGAVFLRAVGRHHSLALFDRGIVGMNHLFVQVESLHDVGRVMDAAGRSGVTQPVSLGYHPQDGTVSAYFASPSGFRVECGWGSRTIGDSWIPGSCQEVPWGHAGLVDLIDDDLAAAGRMAAPATSVDAAVPTFSGVDHVAISVSDLGRSEAWYRHAFRLEKISEHRNAEGTGHIAMRHADSGTVVALQSGAVCGVEHVSFSCADRTQLEHWRASLDEVGADPGTVTEAPYGAGFVVVDPDGTRLKLFAAVR